MLRYAVYFAPRPGPFGNAAAEWLGRDAVTGQAITPPQVPGVSDPAATQALYSPRL